MEIILVTIMSEPEVQLVAFPEEIAKSKEFSTKKLK